MFFFEILITIAVILYSLHWTIKKIAHWKRLPPDGDVINECAGPWGIPILGSMLHLANHRNLFGEFQKYSAKYGKIFSLGIGNFDVIVLNDAKLIQQAYKSPELCGRPQFGVWISRNMGDINRGILFCDANRTWMEQRRFALRSLRDFGFGKDSTEGLILDELEQLVGSLKTQVGKAISLGTSFNASVFNSLWFLLTGSRFEFNDPEFVEIMQGLAVVLQNADVLSPKFFYPWPAKYNLIRRGLWAKQVANNKRTLDLIDREIQNHEATYNPANTRDYMDAYLHEMKKSQGNNSSFNDEEGRRNLAVVCLDLFFAGIETINTTLQWVILFICQNPSVQAKIHQEIDSVIGRERPPCKDDKQKLVYIEAVLSETHRLASVLPFSLFRAVQKDVEFAGYNIPKGVLIYLNLYEAHHNKDYWADPYQFRPERFLDVETQSKLIKHESFMPFGTGKRVCIGETFARDTLFLFVTGLLQKFEFQLDEKSQKSNLDSQQQPEQVELPTTATVILLPKPFNVILKSRSKMSNNHRSNGINGYNNE